MSDLQSKLNDLRAQLAAARAELEAAKAKAAESDDLHAKLNHLTRARAAQDVIASIEQEITSVQQSIAEEQRREHRRELLEKARAISHEIAECREDLEALLYAVSQAVSALRRDAPGIISKWRNARERWLSVFSSLEPGSWPHHGGDIENSRRVEALRRVLNELGDAAEPLTAVPPNLRPTNRLEYPSHEGKNWHAAPPESPEDFGIYVLDRILSR